MKQPAKSYAFACLPCPLGYVSVAMAEGRVSLILWGDTPEILKEETRARLRGAEIENAAEALSPILNALKDYLEHPRADFAFPYALDLQGTDFQQRVWQALRDIPFGKTVSYSDIATQIGHPKAVRAVAQACGQNPCGIIVPCHRVIGKNGTLTGYGYGVPRKKYLLEREGAVSAGLC